MLIGHKYSGVDVLVPTKEETGLFCRILEHGQEKVEIDENGLLKVEEVQGKISDLEKTIEYICIRREDERVLLQIFATEEMKLHNSLQSRKFVETRGYVTSLSSGTYVSTRLEVGHILISWGSMFSCLSLSGSSYLSHFHIPA